VFERTMLPHGPRTASARPNPSITVDLSHRKREPAVRRAPRLPPDRTEEVG